MNCAYHPSTSAVASCVQCGRGLCLDCDYDPSDGSALCYADAKSSADHDYSVATSENTAAKALPIAFGAFAFLIFFVTQFQNGQGLFGFGVGLLVGLGVAAGMWGLYWGFKRWRANGHRIFFFWTWGGGPIESAVRLGISLLFLEIVLAIMILIGLFTGIGRYLENRRVIDFYRADWTKYFPGKWNPQINQFNPVPAREALIDSRSEPMSE